MSPFKPKAHYYYTSCIDPNGTIEKLGGKPLLNMLRTHSFGWTLFQQMGPETEMNESGQLIDDDEDFRDNFTQKVALVHHDLHSEGFFTWLVGEDDHNSSMHVIQLDQVINNFSVTFQ